MADLMSVLSGSMVGFVLGLIGGGGSILAVPLLLYVVGVPSAHLAIGTSAIAVSLSAFANLVGQARLGMVKWRCALTFSAAGIGGAWLGSSLALRVPGEALLVLFGALMVVVGIVMLLRRQTVGDAEVQLTRATVATMLPMLLIAGFAIGALSGFFGIGGGFLIVPGLMLATGMPIGHAIATSLVAVTAFGAATAANYALEGEVDWRVAGLFVAGGVLGGWLGRMAGQRLQKHKGMMATVFAGFVIATGIYVIWHSLA